MGHAATQDGVLVQLWGVMEYVATHNGGSVGLGVWRGMWLTYNGGLIQLQSVVEHVTTHDGGLIQSWLVVEHISYLVWAKGLLKNISI